ncbi:MAG TPA: DUF6056 family protein [Pyrinomonadaceae bacterium]|nr:DUF6056 family protein [Pyrinomonadaceae bacterium]
MPNKPSKIPTWTRSSSAARLIDWLLAASFVLSLIGYACLGSYSRYMADDYAAIRKVRIHGLLGAQISWYQGWTGRFSFTFVYSVLALIGPTTPRFLPGVLLSLWSAATFWAVYRIQSMWGRVSWSKVALFAGVICFATLETAPNIYQSLYWQTAALTHFVPLIPLSLFVGLIYRPVSEERKSLMQKFRLLCAGILTFVGGGFSDTYVVLQSCGLILTILAVSVLAEEELKSRINPSLIAGLVGSLVAFIIVAGAPGNSVRLTYFPRQLGGWDILKLTVWYSGGFVVNEVLTHPITFLLLLILPFLIVLRDLNHRHEPSGDRQLCVRLLLLIPVMVILLIICCTAPGVYALSGMLPERAQILLTHIFICGTVIWSLAAGQYLAERLGMMSHKTKDTLSLVATVAMLFLTLSPLLSFFSILGLRDKARSFAADWDKQDAQLKLAKQSGISDVTVPQIGDFQSQIGKGASDLHLRTDPTFWINRTTATYYGLNSVRASQDIASFP